MEIDLDLFKHNVRRVLDNSCLTGEEREQYEQAMLCGAICMTEALRVATPPILTVCALSGRPLTDFEPERSAKPAGVAP